MISAEVIRGYVDLLVLEALLDEPSYGYAISKRIEEVSEGKYELKETTLYSALRRLEKQGVISSFKGTQSQGRARTYYELTQLGHAHYRERCLEWQETVDLVRRFVRLP
ncbi:PadR family transcriptional regulator [Gulosibacter molinativorax]|uniref:PadR family transcriptional regulator n=1 Tax=Gulosibacter molinativorax TaxID=256821 RepID=A0ABT7C6Z5_9MICO|nr:PadR family transcriptional regulator [Gulosibacter molinativorax]MDJ1370572.1 PadR family transcriptional regulator [Gulosibacter molinativorax]QUY62012.1 Hypotetical protein [Gulosibacter molinativorax]